MRDDPSHGAGSDAQEPVGPRGGTTTVTKTGMVKKNFWVPEEDAEALRVEAFEERRSEAAIMREGLRRVLETEGSAA